MITKIITRIKRLFAQREMYTSETSKVRHLVLKYCVGKGCDIGFGGDKVVKKNCVGIDYAKPYAYTGKDKVDIPCNVGSEPIPVPDHTFDYVYSSHLIEDFADTAAIVLEFCRILKSGGNLILVFPDQTAYEKYCIDNELNMNQHRVHGNMGLVFMLEVFKTLPHIEYEILFSSDCEIVYNVVLVAKITKIS